MSPFLAARVEAMINAPGRLSSSEISSTAYDMRSEIHRLENALTGIMRGAPEGSHAKLTAAAALDLIGRDGLIKEQS